jgi:hypothetical protein
MSSDFFKISLKVFSILTIIFVVFLTEWIQRTGIITIPLGFRHLIILFVFFINWILFGRPVIINQYYALLIALMLIYLSVAYIFVKVSALNYILGTGFTFLFVLVFILGANIITTREAIIKILKGLLAFFVLMSIVPIFTGLITGTNLRNVQPGLFRELGAFGSAMNIGVILSLSLFIITGQKKYIYLALFLSFGVFFTILKKSILSNLFTWIAFMIFQVSTKARLKLFIYGLVFVILTISFVGDDIAKDIRVNVKYYNRVGATKHVRLGMYVASLRIASDYFPFGSGMGTFGSLASIVNGYSKLYDEYGVSKLGFNSQKHVASGHHTLLDTYWPHILAELGFFGTLIFLFIWLFPLISTGYILRFCHDPTIRGMGFFVILMGLIMTNEGFTLYTPEIPAFVVLHSGIVGLCYFHIKNFMIDLKT